MDNEITDVDVIDNELDGGKSLMVRQSETMDIDKFRQGVADQIEMLNILKIYVRDQLTPGVDYYSVKKDTKPSLGQPGAEKINFLFHLIPKPILEERVYGEKEVRYEYIVELYNKDTGSFAGSGVGCCNSLEDKYRYYWDKQGNRHEIDNHINVANTIKKMAYKRAYVDACVKNTMASFLFTQDLEDLPDYYIGKDSDSFGKKSDKIKQPQTTTQQQQPQQQVSSNSQYVVTDKFINAKKYWREYNFSIIDLDGKPETKTSKAGKPYCPEAINLYYFASGLMDKTEINNFYKTTTGKTKDFIFKDYIKMLNELFTLHKNMFNEEMDIDLPEDIEGGFAEAEAKEKIDKALGR